MQAGLAGVAKGVGGFLRCQARLSSAAVASTHVDVGALSCDVACTAGVTPQKVAEVVQATSALVIEELKTKGVFIVPKFFKAMQRKAKSHNKRKETIVVVRVLRSFGGDVANQEGDC